MYRNLDVPVTRVIRKPRHAFCSEALRRASSRSDHADFSVFEAAGDTARSESSFFVKQFFSPAVGRFCGRSWGRGLAWWS